MKSCALNGIRKRPRVVRSLRIRDNDDHNEVDADADAPGGDGYGDKNQSNDRYVNSKVGRKTRADAFDLFPFSNSVKTFRSVGSGFCATSGICFSVRLGTARRAIGPTSVAGSSSASSNETSAECAPTATSDRRASWSRSSCWATDRLVVARGPFACALPGLGIVTGLLRRRSPGAAAALLELVRRPASSPSVRDRSSARSSSGSSRATVHGDWALSGVSPDHDESPNASSIPSAAKITCRSAT